MIFCDLLTEGCDLQCPSSNLSCPFQLGVYVPHFKSMSFRSKSYPSYGQTDGRTDRQIDLIKGFHALIEFTYVGTKPNIGHDTHRTSQKAVIRTCTKRIIPLKNFQFDIKYLYLLPCRKLRLVIIKRSVVIT